MESTQEETTKVEAVYPMTQDGKERLSKLLALDSYLLRPPCDFILSNYAELKRDEREWYNLYTFPLNVLQGCNIFCYIVILYNIPPSMQALQTILLWSKWLQDVSWCVSWWEW